MECCKFDGDKQPKWQGLWIMLRHGQIPLIWLSDITITFGFDTSNTIEKGNAYHVEKLLVVAPLKVKQIKLVLFNYNT